jgi:hypothetical protein
MKKIQSINVLPRHSSNSTQVHASLLEQAMALPIYIYGSVEAGLY